jgi:hypothetical protein
MVRHRQNNAQPLLHALDIKTGNIITINKIQAHHTHLICPSLECQHPVIAVKNTQRTIKHFRHKADPSGNKRECKNPDGALESVVHKLSKKVIIKRGNIYITPHSKPFNRYRGKRINPIVTGRFKEEKQTKVELIDIESEVRRTASDYQPDITATLDSENFIIEIHYKHKVSDEKLDKIIRDDVPAVEISLGHLKNEDISEYEINKALINPNNIKWLHFPERWLSKVDKSDINEHIKNEKKRIDDEFKEKARLEKEKEVQLKMEREQFEKKQTVIGANRYSYRIIDLVKAYTEYLLKKNKISPFTQKDREELKKTFVTIDSANHILTKSINKSDFLFYDIPSSTTYKNLMTSIGDEYRDKIVNNVIRNISGRDIHNQAWARNHLIVLYELEWSEVSDDKLFDFKAMEMMLKTDIYSDELLEYICCAVLPDIKKMLDIYVKDFVLN